MQIVPPKNPLIWWLEMDMGTETIRYKTPLVVVVVKFFLGAGIHTKL
jgi:hypothetical protein